MAISYFKPTRCQPATQEPTLKRTGKFCAALRISCYSPSNKAATGVDMRYDKRGVQYSDTQAVLQH